MSRGTWPPVARRSSPAPSGSSRRSPRSASTSVREHSASACWRTRARSGCMRSTSTPGVGGISATSRMRSRTWRRSTRCCTSSASISCSRRAGSRRPMAVRWLLAAAAAGVLALPAQAASPVSVDPAVGVPETAFHVQAPAGFAIRERTRDRYWFVVHGPGGRRCEGSVTDRVGITPAGRSKTVFVDLPGVRVVTRDRIVPGPWCEGSFSGHVEFRDWRPRSHRYVVHRIGTFGWTVQASSGVVVRPPDSSPRAVTSRRAEAYGRVVRILNGPDGNDLRPEELARIREAADSLVFCDDIELDSDARDGADEIADLAVDLVESGRW